MGGRLRIVKARFKFLRCRASYYVYGVQYCEGNERGFFPAGCGTNGSVGGRGVEIPHRV